MDPATMGPATVGPATVGPATMGTATVGRATVGPATVGRATVGRATVGRATVGRATVGPIGLIDLSPRPAVHVRARLCNPRFQVVSDPHFPSGAQHARALARPRARSRARSSRARSLRAHSYMSPPCCSCAGDLQMCGSTSRLPPTRWNLTLSLGVSAFRKSVPCRVVVLCS